MALRRRTPSSMMTKQAPRFMTTAIVVLYILSVNVIIARAATPTDGCCATCIGKTSSKPYTYDPLVYDQCSAAKGVCCFNCDSGTASQPTIENGEFDSDGVTPQVKAGAWIQLTWSKIARVTYESYQATQIKITTVGNASSEAKAVDNVFFICAKAPGSVVVRGWGSDPCTTVTPEYTIKIVAGSGDGTCADRTPTAPTPTSKANSNSANTADEDPNIAQCNAQRASVVEVNGKKTCVCAAEWTGAPDCAGYPWWKTAATIGGGIAAVLSIAVSIKAFMNSRKAKKPETQERAQNDPVLGEESITIAGGPELSSRSSDSAYQPSLSSAKPSRNKEYSL